MAETQKAEGVGSVWNVNSWHWFVNSPIVHYKIKKI